MTHRIRFAEPADAGTVHDFICQLADYEKLRHLVVSTEADIARELFGPAPILECLLAELPDGQDGWRAAGFALFHPTYSSFAGRRGLFLEDIFVRPTDRGAGLGRALFVRLAGIAQERGCANLKWTVLDWNAPSIAFYRGLGAKPQAEWDLYALDAAGLAALAAQPSSKLVTP